LVNLALSNLSVGVDGGELHDVVIRQATNSDEPKVRAIASHCFENRLLSESQLDKDRVRSMYGEWAANDLKGRVPFTLVAALQGEQAGFVCGGKASVSFPGAAVGFIDLIVVDHTMRHKGIGRALMVAAIEEMREQGLSLVELNVGEGNRPAITLYKRLGFNQRLRYVDLSYWSE
jgi:ribosomal protein S18 acetylase RimI-like enzyme